MLFNGLETHAHPRRRVTVWVTLICMSVFGPYISSTSAGEVAVTLSGVGVLIAGWPVLTMARGLTPLPLAGLWAVIIAVAVIFTVWRPFDPGFYGTQPASHALGLLVMPVLVMAMTWYWVTLIPAERVILVVARGTAYGMAANAAVALAQLGSGNASLPGLPEWWSSAISTSSSPAVAALASANGRYTGIFDQPAEAGIAYGLALLCVIYLVRRGVRWPVAAALAALIGAGGVLSLSKVFLLGAVPLAVWTAVTGAGRVRLLAAATVGAGGMIVAGAMGMLPAWAAGSPRIGELLHPAGSFSSDYTAGRYGSGGSLNIVTADVLRASPAGGFGLHGLYTSYDSLWVEILVLSGITGVIVAGAVVVGLAWRWARLRSRMGHAERSLAGTVLVLSAGAGLGFPSLTSPRAGILVWLILGTLLAAWCPGPVRDDPASAALPAVDPEIGVRHRGVVEPDGPAGHGSAPAAGGERVISPVWHRPRSAGPIWPPSGSSRR